MSIKQDTGGTNWAYWQHKQRAQYLETVEGQPTPDLDNTVTDCPYRFVCECMNLNANRVTETNQRWLENYEYLKQVNANLVDEQKEMIKANQEFRDRVWKWYINLCEKDPVQEQTFFEEVLYD